MAKYVFITGGVVSGLGKGLTAASLGKLMKARGYAVQVVKFNPYFNIDNSNLCPEQYGETFITDDGRACDLVIGHYERILDESLSSRNDITSGEIYSLAIEKERENFYDGQTVQVVPHITDEIKKCILRVGEQSEIVIVEVGGTVGDIEAQPYMEAIRQLKANIGKTNVAYVHVSLLPYIGVSGEQKTKPTQHSVKELQNLGIQPDVIVCRSDCPIGMSSRSKLTLFCNVDKDCVIESQVAPNIYELPLRLEKENFCNVVLRKLRLDEREADLSDLSAFCEAAERLDSGKKGIKIGIIDKNADKKDVNMSIWHSLLISSVAENTKVDIVSVPTMKFSEDEIKGLDGIIITAGMEDEAVSAKRTAIEYAKKSDLPVLMLGDSAFLGLLISGDSSTFRTDKPKKGAYYIKFAKDSLFGELYGVGAEQRFKSCLNVPKGYFDNLSLSLAGVCSDNSVCAYEQKGHRFYVGTFFRPEFSARLGKPSPIISAFIRAAKK